METTLDVPGAAAAAARPATPWREIVRLALLGTIAVVLWVFADSNGLAGGLLSLVQPGTEGPAVELIREDFPTAELPNSMGLDGQQFYAMARDPFDLDKVSDSLDRPEYRLRRPFYAWAAATLHPTGGGEGLILAMAAIGVLAVLGGGIAAGALSTGLGGATWPAAVFPVLPGAFFSLRVSVADALAVALALGALALVQRNRFAPALVCAVAATFTKETVILVLVGWAISQRNRRAIALPIVSAAALGAWMLWLRIVLPDRPAPESTEIVAPFTGFPQAVRHWLEGMDHRGMVATCAALACALLLLARNRVRHPLSWAIVLNLGLVSVMHWNVLALDFGGTRSTMPLLALSLIALASPAAARERQRPEITPARSTSAM